jgi:UDP:flavonoid glycosyltransferase YjiC (YdhE family)
MKTIAYFVSPHGFGHAARTCAVIDALLRRGGAFQFHIFTTVPEWFFSESLPGCFSYHHCVTDIGLVQLSPLEEDLPATVRALDAAPWRNGREVEELARYLRQVDSSLVVADISPLGLVAARRAGLPTALVENFTWDWIYTRLDGPGGLESHGHELSEVCARVDLRIQTDPVCSRVTGAVEVGPVARPPRLSRKAVRRRLGIPDDDSVVLASMGGLGWNYECLDGLASGEHPWVVVPGGAESVERHGRLVLLPFHSDHYHPDLVHACDVVVGKLGYSTVAEAVHAGPAYAYVQRPRFPESPILARFVEHYLNAAEIDREAFAGGDWMPVVGGLLEQEKKRSGVEAGAEQAARVIVERFPELFD